MYVNVCECMEGVFTGGPAGRHVCGRGVGFPPPDDLICRRLGFILLHFVTVSEASRDFCAAGAIFSTKSYKSSEKLQKCRAKKKQFLICCRARREESKKVIAVV